MVAVQSGLAVNGTLDRYAGGVSADLAKSASQTAMRS